MKMSDVFDLHVEGNLVGDYSMSGEPCLKNDDGGYYAIFNMIEHAEAAALAINNHDKLVGFVRAVASSKAVTEEISGKFCEAGYLTCISDFHSEEAKFLLKELGYES